jgi:hypothetical protein
VIAVRVISELLSSCNACRRSWQTWSPALVSDRRSEA